jgi:hypothetical protein
MDKHATQLSRLALRALAAPQPERRDRSGIADVSETHRGDYRILIAAAFS